jgi:hypothetical protein
VRGSLWRHGQKESCIQPDEWPSRTGRARVLIEHPDPAVLWAEAEAMRDAGYDVAVCTGPTRTFERPRSGGIRLRAFADEEARVDQLRQACPLLANGRCSLVEQADVVVSTTDLGESQSVLAALSDRRTPPLVVESSKSVLDRGGYEIGDATVIDVPVTEKTLLEAVSEALNSR